MKRILCAAIAAIALLATSVSAADTITPEMYMNWERVNDAQLSPDGSQVAYVRSRVDEMNDRWQSEIWLMNADGSKNRFLVKGSGLRWSPAGDRIAYVAQADDDTRQVFVRWMDDEGAVSQLTHVQNAPRMIRWAPDGSAIAFRARVPAKSDWAIKIAAPPKGAKWQKNATVIDDLHYRQDRVGMIAGYDHLFMVPSEGGTARQLTSGKWHTVSRFSGMIGNAPFAFTPDSASIIFDGNGPGGDPDETQSTSNIHKLDIASGEITQLTQEFGYWANPAVSPNGETIVYSGKSDIASTYGRDQVRAIGTDGSNERLINDDLPAGAGGFMFSRRNDRVYFSVRTEGDIQIMRLRLNGRIEAITEGMHQVTMTSMTEAGVFVGRYRDPDTDFNLVIGDVSDGEITQLTDLNADVMAGITPGAVEEIWYDSSDDTRVQGWVMTPPDFDASKKYPLLLYIHGGPHGMYGVNFNFLWQALAARGYVVVYTNPRGSVGYGSDFANAIDNRYPGRRDFDDLMAGVDTVVGRGIIDESQMYVAGCSGGGVLTTWTVGNTERFAGAAALCPVINWISFAGTADIVSWGYKRFRTPWWEDPDLWIKHSPLARAPYIKTPTLFMTGDKDLRTPLAQAEEMYSALKVLGTPTKLVVIHGEYHGTTSIPSNMLRTVEILDKWFKQWKKE
ncbi:MAG: S9 family peptidase [Kordiimonadaceae bacterium]|nr:S9 family peptidase [Kordiimonadaceae bacterium]MBO6567377.1 S9 family peptidase [Kordiimonadaceae bacterium]MBO6963409.1 S9 family peptidase [Kordiimonadaceae bacterium]